MGSVLPVDARAIANRILAKGMAEGVPLDPMKLLKLTYIAHGWMLGLTGEPLICQTVEAWPYGPVIPDVYQSFKRFGASRVDTPAMKWDGSASWKPYDADLPPDAAAIVDRTWDLYKPFSGLQLSTLTHAPGSPWETVTRGKKPEEIRDLPIPEPVIRDHYHALAVQKGR
jgi:uncharacterized phage-associated protein